MLQQNKNISKEMPYSSLLKYEREKGKIIFFSDFQIGTKFKSTAERCSKRLISTINYQKICCFSVIFNILNNNKDSISSAI